MHLTVKRLAVLGVLGTTLGIAAPVASASAAATPVAPAKPAAFAFPGFPEAGVPAFTEGAFPFGGPVLNGQTLGDSVSGAIIITTAPTSFINTNNQTSPGGNVTGGQVAGP